MNENIRTIRKSILAIENFEQIAAFNESRKISGKLVGGAWAMHVHDFFEVRILFNLTADGEVDYTRIEDIHITPPYQAHYGVDSSEIKRMCTILVGDNKLIYGECSNTHHAYSLPEEGELVKEISKAEFTFPAAALTNYYLHHDHDPEYLRLIILLLFTLIGKLAKLSKNMTFLPADSIAIYIRSNYYRKDLSVSEIAEKYGYSPNYIQKVFKSKWDCTLIEYIKRTRLNAARLLLKQHRWQVKDVSRMCGFSYVHYFCKCYRKFFGHLPGEE